MRRLKGTPAKAPVLWFCREKKGQKPEETLQKTAISQRFAAIVTLWQQYG